MRIDLLRREAAMLHEWANEPIRALYCGAQDAEGDRKDHARQLARIISTAIRAGYAR